MADTARRDYRAYSEVVKGPMENKKRTFVVRGEVAKENMKRLKCSLVGKHLEPIDISNVRSCLESAGFGGANFRMMDSYKVLITMNTEQEVKELMEKGVDFLRVELEEMRSWSREKACKVRRVWLECVEVPIQAWTSENFKRIGDTWGKFINCDEETKSISSFMIARLMIDTMLFSPSICGFDLQRVTKLATSTLEKSMDLVCVGEVAKMNPEKS